MTMNLPRLLCTALLIAFTTHIEAADKPLIELYEVRFAPVPKKEDFSKFVGTKVFFTVLHDEKLTEVYTKHCRIELKDDTGKDLLEEGKKQKKVYLKKRRGTGDYTGQKEENIFLTLAQKPF